MLNLELLTLIRDFRKNLKMCKKESFQVILQIMFVSIFKTYHGASILCCTTTHFGNFYVKRGFFGTAFGILGAAFVRAPNVKPRFFNSI